MNAPITGSGGSGAQPGMFRLDRAQAAVREASGRLISDSLEGPGDCQSLLEEARKSLEAFLAESVTLQTAAHRAPLRERVLELRKSLEMFSAQVLQWRTYFESLAAELLRGQMNYDPVSVRTLSNTELERAIRDL